ncbi:toxin-antitoxin system YwqK family antitoxin [Plebeiibacterium sediminum]|uniref:Toxin-antitoxin system YwqK family antitoxin n=1 Tax=Plebeiibacterium sediminum TaxID=2992112 RepID=A0AAE3SFY2_9BACT|nr:hypothetical protein [Plebeiobacterium sediminum]MCW3787903.1 hypothetical protein [Plebeiobacterium sediminum]
MLLFFVMDIPVLSQNKATREVIIQRNDTIEEFSILIDKEVTIKQDNKTFYYWYAFNRIRKNQGAYSGKLLNGTYKKYKKDYLLIESGYFKMGVKDGAWSTWNSEGNMILESRYVNGLKDGTCFYYEDAKLLKKEEYKKGLLNGNTTFYTNDSTYTLKYKDGVEVIKENKDYSSRLFVEKIKNIFKKRSSELHNENTEDEVPMKKNEKEDNSNV